MAAGLLVLVGALAACGGSDGEGGEGEGRSAEETLALTTDAADICSRLTVVADLLVEDQSDEARDQAAEQLEKLRDDAAVIASGAEAGDGAADQELATAAECFESPLRQLERASVQGPGEQAQSLAKRARRQLEGCKESLRDAVVALRDDLPDQAGDLLARLDVEGRSLDGSLRRLVNAFAPPAEETPTAEGDGQPEQLPACSESLPPCIQQDGTVLQPGEPTEEGYVPEAADLPLCSEGPPPCRQNGEIVEP